jgi:hypothetical protein
MTLRPGTRLIRLIAAGLTASSCAALAACAAGAPATQEKRLTEAQQAAVSVARKALPAEARAAGEPEMLSVEPRQWPDSSLGCPQRGLSYLQVITDGYVVKFAGAGGEQEVRVAGESAVICDQSLAGVARRPGSASRVTNIEEMQKQAVADLAARLNVPEDQIRVVRRIAQRWEDDSLGCASMQSSTRGVVAGFKLVLDSSGRRYTYHTDLARVMACPPIEAQ